MPRFALPLFHHCPVSSHRLKMCTYFGQRIRDVLVNMLILSAVDCRFEHRSGQTKDYKIGICCFSSKHAALRRKSKDWLARESR
jgi:hypothetical protein